MLSRVQYSSRAFCIFSVLVALVACSPQQSSVQQPNAEQANPEPAVQQTEIVTADDYARAERFLAQNANPQVIGRIINQWWQEDDRLVYRRATATGSDYVLIDPVAQTRSELFDTQSLAEALRQFADDEEEFDPLDLALGDFELNADELRFDFESRRYAWSLPEQNLAQFAEKPENEYLSPDGSRAAFIQDHNLWIRDTASNQLTQLTFDGSEDYGYATNNAGWIRNKGPVLKWSPDSSKIATFRHDGRQVEEMALWSTQVGHSDIDLWKYPLAGDEHIFMIERVVIHLDPSPRLVRLDMPADPHRSSTSDHVAGSGGVFLDVQWSDDSQLLAFLSSSRDHKQAVLRLADPVTGAVSDIYEERVETYFESGFSDANWRVLPEREQFIWFSERSNWGHLYLGDLNSGEIVATLTSGEWPVLDVQLVDEAAGQVYFTAAGRDAQDPYFHALHRVGLDGSGPELLTPEAGHHVLRWSESRAYFSDYVSTPQNPGAYLLRTRNGEVLMTLEEPDIGGLLESGWQPPESFVVKARDQLTNIHGLLYTPTDLDPQRSYPVLNYLYPGPQSGSVGTRSFRAARSDKQALAELGFIVVELDAMGTPGRSKSFHDAYYGNMGDNGLPDQIAGIRQLAASRPWMDLDRVGIWGHSGGGFASTAGILRYPDFYKVAVSGAGNHDNRNYEDDWGEKWQGLLEVYPESSGDASGDDAGEPRTNYDNQANQLLADQLEGKLLLAHGMMDTNVHPSSTLLVVDALIEAEKDFDLLMLPNAGHGFGNRRYFMKRRWDYFVEHLMGVEPPADFRFADNIP